MKSLLAIMLPSWDCEGCLPRKASLGAKMRVRVDNWAESQTCVGGQSDCAKENPLDRMKESRLESNKARWASVARHSNVEGWRPRTRHWNVELCLSEHLRAKP